MRNTTTIDKAGRLVIPKRIRESMGLTEGGKVTLQVRGGILEATPAVDSGSVRLKDGFPVIGAGDGGKSATSTSVRQAVRDDRQQRDKRINRSSE
jgi:AbrB family looped-hinge helix DNA binding protein